MRTNVEMFYCCIFILLLLNIHAYMVLNSSQLTSIFFFIIILIFVFGSTKKAVMLTREMWVVALVLMLFADDVEVLKLSRRYIIITANCGEFNESSDRPKWVWSRT